MMTDNKTQAQKTVKKVEKKAKSYKTYLVDFDQAVSNNLMSLDTAVKYFTQHVKVNGLKNKLEDFIKVSTSDKRDKNRKNNLNVQVDTKMKFAKRYIKYLVKKFLKRENISLYLRVVANAPNSYVVKLYSKTTEQA
jgi:large subunit ribosomal protein L22e